MEMDLTLCGGFRPLLGHGEENSCEIKQKKNKKKPNKQLGRHVCVNLMDWRFEGDCELTVIIRRLTNTETRTCQCVFMPGHKEGHCWKCAGYTRIYCVINLWFLFSSEPTCETWRSIMIIYNLNITFHLLYMSHSQSETVWLQNYQWLFICFASATMGHLSCWLEDMWFSDLRQTQSPVTFLGLVQGPTPCQLRVSLWEFSLLLFSKMYSFLADFHLISQLWQKEEHDYLWRVAIISVQVISQWDPTTLRMVATTAVFPYNSLGWYLVFASLYQTNPQLAHHHI